MVNQSMSTDYYSSLSTEDLNDLERKLRSKCESDECLACLIYVRRESMRRESEVESV
jgi:hypothetical protein